MNNLLDSIRKYMCSSMNGEVADCSTLKNIPHLSLVPSCLLVKGSYRNGSSSGMGSFFLSLIFLFFLCSYQSGCLPCWVAVPSSLQFLICLFCSCVEWDLKQPLLLLCVSASCSCSSSCSVCSVIVRSTQRKHDLSRICISVEHHVKKRGQEMPPKHRVWPQKW